MIRLRLSLCAFGIALPTGCNSMLQANRAPDGKVQQWTQAYAQPWH